MNLQIDSDSAVPIYLQIVDGIKHDVVVGRLKPGEQLPTVREFATELRINPNTVTRAYDQLVADGVITTQQGRGTFVRERPDQAHLSRVHAENLKTMMHSVIGKALSQGYTRTEIEATFEEQIARWTRQKKG